MWRAAGLRSPRLAKIPTGNDGFVKFNLGGYALCLINRQAFAEDAGFSAAAGNRAC